MQASASARPHRAFAVKSRPDVTTSERLSRRALGTMRIPKIRFTVRGMMVIVLAVGIFLHVTTAAWRAYRSGFPHLHSSIVEYGGNPGKAVSVRSEPFWPA